MSENPKGRIAKVELPKCAAPLADKYRYYIMYGGRNGVKTWSIARHLLIEGAQYSRRWLCCRETMNSISESVHATLEDQIKLMGLGAHYDVQKNAIYGTGNETRFVYAGLRGLKNDKTALKAYESFDGAWVEEAQSASRSSWSTLIPTIRKKGSRIFVSFNPELESDETWQRFIINTPPNCVLIPTSWRDNPWLSDEAKADMAHLKATNPEEYDHIYEGHCVKTVEGAVFVDQLRALDRENRITQVKYDPARPVDTFWDLGYGDATAIWFVQSFPFEYRFIDYLEGNRFILKHYQKELQSKPYVYKTHYLPHDARAKDLRTGRSIEELMRSSGFSVQIVPRLAITDTINAARTLFPQCWFDGERCADGLQALRHYRWGPPTLQGVTPREPVHDWASHGGSAFRYAGVTLKPGPATPPITDPRNLNDFGYDEDAIGVWS